jgi:hypothetical protein
VGFLERAKAMLGMDRPAPGDEEADPPRHSRPAKARARKDGRPPLPEMSVGSTATLEDVLTARAAGSFDEARGILAAIDKGQGLRTVLRAAAALEAGDEQELAELLPAVVNEQPAWQLRLQVAAAIEAGPVQDALVRQAEHLGAPAWSLSWLRALSSRPEQQREGLVDLLFEDAALARTVASRDLGMAEVKPDHDAVRRYAAFAHGRDIVRRFGPSLLAKLLERASGAT